MSQSDLWALVLAAGKGTRLYSSSPKVLRRLIGEPMLYYVYQALEPVVGQNVLTVTGFGADELEEVFASRSGSFVRQEKQLGTGHALMVSMDALREKNATHCLVINGDTPLIDQSIVAAFTDQAASESCAVAFLTINLEEPAGYGRVIRDSCGDVIRIVERKDFDPAIHGQPTGEVNAGIYYLDLEAVSPLLDRMTTANNSGEYYITDLVGLALESGLKACGVNMNADSEVIGVNTARELHEAEKILCERIAAAWLDRGVIMHHPEMITIGPSVALDPGVELYGPVELYGTTSITGQSVIHSHTVIRDSEVDGAVIHSHSHLEQARVAKGCSVGPYGRLRPGAVMEEDSRIGNFVEVKKSVLHRGVKASHLTYLGDAEIGEETNIGAGTITCNYDGVNKHKTEIGKKAFIGSNTALVAPVKVGDKVLVGAGSTVTKDVPEGEMAIARGKQKNIRRRNKSS